MEKYIKFRALLSNSEGSQFRRNFFGIARASGIALILPLIATPLMTRLYLPNEFGSLAIFLSILGVVFSFSTWRFDWVLPNARSNRMAAILFVIGVVILLTVSVLLSFALFLITEFRLYATPISDLGNLVFFLPVALVGMGLRQMLSVWFVRGGDLAPVSRVTIVQSATNVIAGLTAGYANFGALGLIGANVLAAWAGFGALARRAGSSLVVGVRRVSRTSLLAGLARHGRNATWSTAVSVINALSLNAPVILLATFYLPREIGWYALVFRLVAAPVGVFTTALAKSYWTKAAQLARARRNAELRGLYYRTTLRLLMACILVAIACLSGPFIVGPILGAEEWGGAGYVLVAMAPLFIGSLLFSPTNHLVVLDKQHLQLVADGARLALVSASILIAAYLKIDFMFAVFMASLSSFVGHFLLFVMHVAILRKAV